MDISIGAHRVHGAHGLMESMGLMGPMGPWALGAHMGRSPFGPGRIWARAHMGSRHIWAPDPDPGFM